MNRIGDIKALVATNPSPIEFVWGILGFQKPGAVQRHRRHMGMWLGISLVAVYDFMATALGWAQRWTVAKRRKRVKPLKKDPYQASGVTKKIWNEQKFSKDYYW
ncbi:hypothetical protein CEXT_45781 [Caerostris extrusa]|uniref:Uncharacterized protein n=1 Tax=Caerostris extrusa TaxID=172846 RepID=A0AAV4XDP1_CAEEX|nr:hypothetical protein CEXT_45781 [Caerostris extrusa]